MAYVYPVATVGSKYLLTLVGRLAGQTIMSTFWYRLKTAVDLPTHGDICTGILTRIADGGAMREKYLACCPGNYTMIANWCQPIDIFRYAKFNVVTDLAGTSTFAADTPNVAQVILRRGVEAERRAVSKLHVPSPTLDGWIDNGLLTADALLALQALADKLPLELTLPGGHVVQPIIRNGILPEQHRVIGDALAMTTVRVMTRRTVGRGI